VRCPCTALALALALLCGAAARGQQATERYIPLGRSPGLSGEATHVGRVVAADPRQRTLTVEGAAGARRARITGQTRIWIDRSHLGESNTPASFADCELGYTAEIHYEGDEGAARWVKLRGPQRPPPPE
jgi:hypothetical protein